MPNRIIHEKVCTSDTLAQLSADEERFFYRLLVQCDDYGRFDARSAVVRARCFPLQLETISDVDVEAWLQRLSETGLLRLYQVDGRLYLQVNTWERHQQIRAKRSRFPQPPAPCEQPTSIDSRRNQIPSYPESESESESESPSGGAETPQAASAAIATRPEKASKTLKPVPKPKGTNLAVLFEAFKAAGLDPPPIGMGDAVAGVALLRAHPPPEIAYCWQYLDEHGSQVDRQNLSLRYLAMNNRVPNILRDRDALTRPGRNTSGQTAVAAANGRRAELGPRHI